MHKTYNVYVYFMNGPPQCLRKNLNAEDAYTAAQSFIGSIAAQMGLATKVTIVDDNDFNIFEWTSTKGIIRNDLAS